jgi:hypothetical protein
MGILEFGAKSISEFAVNRKIVLSVALFNIEIGFKSK